MNPPASARRSVDPASVRNLLDYLGPESAASRVRRMVKHIAITSSASFRRSQSSHCIRFPYYHHVFDDERAGFANQVAYFRNTGEIVGIDDAVAAIRNGSSIRDRYYCITFDDGFRNNYTNAVPILAEHGATAAFFIPVARIREERHWDPNAPVDPYASDHEPEYLVWSECVAMQQSGMVIGSHGMTHRPLRSMSASELESELVETKEMIEARLGSPCNHFACPWGRPGIDFNQDREPVIAKRVGFHSFLTTERGHCEDLRDPFSIPRDQLMANWPQSYLKYFFGA